MYNGLHMLKTLNLSCNDRTYLKRASFNSLHNLKLLDISHNKIAATETDAFQNLPRLEKLILDYNEIIYVQSLHLERYQISENTNLNTIKLQVFHHNLIGSSTF